MAMKCRHAWPMDIKPRFYPGTAQGLKWLLDQIEELDIESRLPAKRVDRLTRRRGKAALRWLRGMVAWKLGEEGGR